MDRREMESRTMQFALRVMRLCRALPKTFDGRAVANQLMRCGSSVGSNYRASGRARSNAEFVAKLGVVEEEADESCFWLELIIEAGMLNKSRVQHLLDEARELLSIIVASKKTARRSKATGKSQIAHRTSKIEHPR